MSKLIEDVYSPISVIDCEQIMTNGNPEHTDFSYKMYEYFRDNSYIRNIRKYYDEKDYFYTYQKKNDIASYILLKSYYKDDDGFEDCCLGSRVMEDWEKRQLSRDYRKRYVGKQFAIVPTIPYKYVSKIAKMYKTKFDGNYSDYYVLGYYPKGKINFSEAWCYVDFANEFHYIKNKKLEHLPNKSEFRKIGEYFRFPIIEDDQLKLGSWCVRQAKTPEGTEIKAVCYCDDEYFRIEPVVWKKVGDDLVCANILFESPVHMKNDFVQNCNIRSLGDTFVKWYIDNIFAEDLFKYTDLSFMKEQMPLGIDEEIDSKLKEIERLKQIKANLILQQQSEEHIIDTAHRNITRLFEEETKEQVVKTLHK